MTYTMHTQFIVHVTHELGDDGHDVNAKIVYTVDRGYPATLQDPGCGPSVSISDVYVDGVVAPSWLAGVAEDDAGLIAELLAHAADCDEHARDQAADARREELQMERF